MPDDVEPEEQVAAERPPSRPPRRDRGWSRRSPGHRPRPRRRRRPGARATTRGRGAAWPGPRAASRRSRRGTACRRVASTNRPSRDSRASVNAPRRTPNSSASTRPLGSAAQLIWTSGPSRRATVLVDPARERALARAALAGDQHGRIGARRAAREVEHPVHRRAARRPGRGSLVHRRRVAGAAGQSRAASMRSRSARSIASTSTSVLNGLVTKSHAPARTRLDGELDAAERGDQEHDAWRGLRSSTAASSSVPAHPRHLDVADHDVEVLGG